MKKTIMGLCEFACLIIGFTLVGVGLYEIYPPLFYICSGVYMLAVIFLDKEKKQTAGASDDSGG